MPDAATAEVGTTLAVRVIPCLDVDGGRVVKGVNFVDLRDAGDPVEMARVYGLGRYQLFRQVVFPGSLPTILVGVRYALGFTWLTLIVAETIAATSGIGYMTMNARDFLQTDVVVLGILIYALLGKLADVATVIVERRCLKWHPAFQNKEIP